MKFWNHLHHAGKIWAQKGIGLAALCLMVFGNGFGQITPVVDEVGAWVPLARTAASPSTNLNTISLSNALRPGFNANTYVAFGNSGPEEATNVVAIVVVDPRLEFLEASVPPDARQGDSLIWHFASMPSGHVENIAVLVHIPATTTLGTCMKLQSSLTGVGEDSDLSDNQSSRNLTVTGSFDPNDKMAWDDDGYFADGPTNPATENLFYMIRFQNIGTDTAMTVVVRDTLDANLNASTLTIGSASHSYTLSVTGGNQVEVTFANIMLVDSATNEPASHGYVYLIQQLVPGLPVGTVITNRASIYFDFNSPVVTNTVQTILCPLLNQDFSFSQNITTFSFTDLSDPLATSWLWDFGDGFTSTLQNPVHTFATQGAYNVCLSVSNFCRTETICKSVALVGINDDVAVPQFKLFPNPSQGVFQLEAALPKRGNVRLQVVDAKGALILSQEKFLPAGPFSETINLNDQSSGLYFLRLEHDGNLYGFKLEKL